MSSTSTDVDRATALAARGWRTVDIVVTAVIGVAFGVVFWAWNLVWAATGPAFEGFPPLQALIYGVWLLPAVLAPLVVRKPGAAVFAEVVAASVSALLGSQWGLAVLLYGLVQGVGAELVFAMTGYRRWGLPVAGLAAAAAGVGAWLLDVAIFYPEWPGVWQAAYGLFLIASTVAVAGFGAAALVRSLAATGVLTPFPSGRAQERI